MRVSGQDVTYRVVQSQSEILAMRNSESGCTGSRRSTSAKPKPRAYTSRPSLVTANDAPTRASSRTKARIKRSKPASCSHATPVSGTALLALADSPSSPVDARASKATTASDQRTTVRTNSPNVERNSFRLCSSPCCPLHALGSNPADSAWHNDQTRRKTEDRDQYRTISDHRAHAAQ